MAALLRGLSGCLQRALASAIRHPRLWLALFAVLTLGLGSRIPTLKSVLAVDELVDESFAATRSLRELKRVFHVGEDAFVVFRPRDGQAAFTDAQLCELRRWISAEAARAPGLTRAFSPFSLRTATATAGRLWYPELLPLDCDGRARQSDSLERRRLLGNSPWHLIVTDRETRDVGVELSFEPGAGGSELIPALMDSAPAFPQTWAGSAVYAFRMREGLRKTGALNLAVLLFLLVALRLAFGTWKAGGLYVGALLLSGVILYGAMAVAGTPIDVLNNSLFLLLAVAALEDFVFVSHSQLRRPGAPWSSHFRRLLVPGFFTSLTTLVGFGSLGISELAIIRRFGAWAAVAAGLEWVAIFLFLPSLASLWPRARHWTDPGRALFSGRVERLGRALPPRRLAFACLLAYVAAGAAFPKLTVSDAPVRIFPPDHPFRQALTYLKASRGWESDVSLLFPAGASREANERVIERVRKLPGIVTFESPYASLEFVRRGLPPLSRELVGREFTQTELARRLSPDGGPARAILYLADTDLRAINRLAASVSEICARGECSLAGELIAYAEFANRVPRTLLESLVSSLLLVGGVLAALAFALGQARATPALLASSFWGAATMLVVLVVFGVRMNFLTCIFASVLVGLTGDNAVQFLFAARRRGLDLGLSERAGGSIQCTIVMAFASLLFLGSTFEPPRIFGWLLFAGLLASLGGDLWILRGLLPARAPEGISGA
jgi:predicted RND superfamily exporter protein